MLSRARRRAIEDLGDEITKAEFRRRGLAKLRAVQEETREYVRQACLADPIVRAELRARGEL